MKTPRSNIANAVAARTRQTGMSKDYAKEVAALRGLPQALQRQAFFKCWTSKEAFLKAKGTGLSGALDEVEISLTKDQQVHISASVPHWWLRELSPISDYEAALVSAGTPVPIHCYRWLVS